MTSLRCLLTGRMGNCRRALQMIMEELEDVDKAIEFAKEQDDAELWEDLISYSIDKPRMMTKTRRSVSQRVSPCVGCVSVSCLLCCIKLLLCLLSSLQPSSLVSSITSALTSTPFCSSIASRRAWRFQTWEIHWWKSSKTTTYRSDMFVCGHQC